MGFRAQTDRGQDEASAPSRSPSNKSERMSYWRWLLFAAMARFEVQEDVQLRLPNVKIIRRDVPNGVCPKQGSADPSGSIGQVRKVALDSPSTPMRLVSWLRRIGGSVRKAR
jgi:hypothetical protein